MFGLTGFQTAILLIAVIAVILLAIHIFAPKSGVARLEDKLFKYVDGELAEMPGMAIKEWGKATRFFDTEADAVAAGWQKIVPTFENELQKLLDTAESHIIDTSGEDQDIADANDAIRNAHNKRSAKFALGRAHLARVQAALDAKDPQPAGPTA